MCSARSLVGAQRLRGAVRAQAPGRGVVPAGPTTPRRESGRPAPAARLERQPRLAGAAGTGERQEAHIVAGEQRRKLCNLGVAAQEWRGRNGQVGLVQGLERRVAPGAELVDALGSGEILQPMQAQVAQLAGLDSCAVAALTRIWPPWPAAAMRAARWTSAPT